VKLALQLSSKTYDWMKYKAWQILLLLYAFHIKLSTTIRYQSCCYCIFNKEQFAFEDCVRILSSFFLVEWHTARENLLYFLFISNTVQHGKAQTRFFCISTNFDHKISLEFTCTVIMTESDIVIWISVKNPDGMNHVCWCHARLISKYCSFSRQTLINIDLFYTN